MKNKNKKQNEMNLSILAILANFGTKLATLFSTCWGWLGATALTLLAFLSPLKYLVLVVVILVIVDLILGIWNHRKHILSSKLRATVTKLGLYLTLLILSFSAEAVLGIFILYKIVFALISLVELFSIVGNASIIAPNLLFLKLFKGLLKSEIAKKLEIPIEKVDEVLEKKKNKKSEI